MRATTITVPTRRTRLPAKRARTQRPAYLPIALLLVALPGIALIGCATRVAPRTAQLDASVAPVAPRRPQPRTLHGQTRIDDYAWLSKKDDPDVLAYLRAENAYSERMLQPTVALREAIFRETVGRIVQTDRSAPVRRGQFLYYARTQEGLQYAIECRAPLAQPSAEQVLLDANELAKRAPFVDIGEMEVSDDGTRLAYTLDTTGFRDYTLHLLELGSRAHGPERIAKVSSVAWAGDGRSLFYVVEDAAKRPHRLYRHAIDGSAPDTLVYEETDERFVLHVWRSRSKALVLAGSFSHTASEVRFVSATEPAATLTVIAPRRADHEYHVDHRGDRFYIRSNDRGRNFRIVTAPVGTPTEAHWQELVAHRDAVMVEDLDVFDRFMVVLEREDGVPHVRVSDPEGANAHRVALPEPVYEVYGEQNPEPDSDRYRFSYESLTTPETHYDYVVAERALAVVKQKQVLGGYDPANYRSERIAARAADGTLIPISLVQRVAVGSPAGGSSAAVRTKPLLLTGYGAYGYPLPAAFSYSRVSLLDRGVTFAIAHVRGGGELGKRWHDAGRMQHKGNSFGDFIAAAEHLIHAGYTAPDRLAIEGASAGGLLIGAVLNQRPDLFRAALLDVPFVDVLNTMSDPSLPLTVGEFEEWGNPAVLEQYRTMAAYSPYDNLRAQPYPAILVETSYNDSQVMYWEPAKYVAKLRTLKKDHNPLLLWVNMAGGHGGSSGRYDQWRERAFDLAFLLSQLGITR